MPTYQYACTNPECGERFDRVQSFTDPAVSECPVCGQAVRKVYGSVGVVFKGSGFYRNDSRAGAKGGDALAPAGAKESSSKESAGASKDSSSKESSNGSSSKDSNGSSSKDSSSSSSSKESAGSSAGSSSSASAGSKSSSSSSSAAAN